MTPGVTESQITDLNWGSLVLLGLLAMVFGILIAAFPGVTIAILIELIGIFIIILSFGTILRSAVAPGGLQGSILLAIVGIIGFFFGIATILSPFIMGKVIFVVAGIALLIGGCLGLILAISEKKMTHRGLFAIQAIFSLIIGIMIMAVPASGAALLIIIIGAYFVIWGIISVIMGVMIKTAK
ncbi:MAG: DUF308 domain-containing protein [Methanomicrobiales archaeon]|nr:DUF308 domain-containing protein [Methanomicrobiales archaeon]